jgi:RHS repeat-associated protein
LANISRHDYLPFGEELTAGYGGRTSGHGYTGDCVRDKFVGYERDAETGLDYAEARYHGSVYGRFTSVDPALGSARKSLPQSWNRYSYVMNQLLSLIDPTGEYWIYKAGEILRRVKDSPKIAPEHERRAWEGQGYIVLDDNSEVYLGGGGTGYFAQYNHSLVRLGEDGEIHFIRSNVGEKMVGLMVAAPIVGFVALPAAAKIAPLATTSVLLEAVGTPQGIAAVGLIAGLGGATAVDVLTEAAPPDDDDDDTLNVGLGLEQHLQPWARDNGFVTYTDVAGPVFDEGNFTILMNKANTINFNLQGFSEKNFRTWLETDGELHFGGPTGSTVANWELHQVMTNPDWSRKLIPHNGKLPTLPKKIN